MSAETVPYARLGIPQDLILNLVPTAPRARRLAAARGTLQVRTEVQLSVGYLLAADPDPEVRQEARAAICAMPASQLADALHPRTHSKVLELVAVLRGTDPEVAARLYANLNSNDRTAILIAGQAGPDLCERIVDNKQRLLITPGVLVALHGNRNCSDALLERAASFLRMEEQAFELPPRRPWEAPADTGPALEAEVEAALGGRVYLEHRPIEGERLTPFVLPEEQDGGPLAGFSFDFQDEMSIFSTELLEERDETFDSENDRQDMEKILHGLPVGQRVRLAYLGNRQVRQILIRDTNKMVAVAVIRSGRCGDAEIASVASNRHIHDDVLREVAKNLEWIRKYPVRVALVNNPKTPVATAVSLVAALQVHDLAELARNHNVSSVVTAMAQRLHQQKARARLEGRGGRR
ncbi:MAG: hypothetical protein JXB39_04565 [Deltaproteobacteria bacterium]|nr:hypothetical protein [Deltaproteobacteria bacterium]